MRCDNDMEIHLSLFLTFARLPLRGFFGTALLLAILFPLAALSLSRSCYFPDGTAATNNVPCNPSWDESACCGASWVCLDNGTLCYPPKDDPNAMADIARGSCTDMMWQSGDCPWPCKGMLICFICIASCLHISTHLGQVFYLNYPYILLCNSKFILRERVLTSWSTSTPRWSVWTYLFDRF